MGWAGFDGGVGGEGGTQKKHPTKKAPNNGCFFSASWRLPWAP